MLKNQPNEDPAEQVKPIAGPADVSTSDPQADSHNPASELDALFSEVHKTVANTKESYIHLEKSDTSSPQSFLDNFANSTINSPGTYIFAGTSIYCFASGQIVSAFLFAALETLAISNRMLFAKRKEHVDYDQRGIMHKTLTSPTVDFKFASAQMLFAAGEAIFNQSLMCIPNLLFSWGEKLAGNLQRKKIKEDSELIKNSWLQNPALYFASGNVLVNLFNSGFNLGLVPGTALAGLALVSGVIASRDKTPPSGLTYRILGASHISYGIFNLISGNFGIASAFFLWTPSALMQGYDQDQIRSEALEKLKSRET